MPLASPPLSPKEYRNKLSLANMLFGDHKTRFGERTLARNMRIVQNLRVFSTEMPREVALAGLFYQLSPEKRRALPAAVNRILNDADKLSQASNNSSEFLKLISKGKVRPSALLVNMASALATLEKPDILPEERQRIGRLALWVHAPLADSLGLHWVSHNIGDLGLKHGYPREYSEIVDSLTRGEREFERSVLPKLREKIRDSAEEMGVHYEFSHRVKQPYSAFVKLVKYFGSDEVSPDSLLLNDAVAMRVVLHGDEKKCYDLVRRLQGTPEIQALVVDDYIKRPKHNGYQSLHVNVKPHDSHYSFELQVRTRAMHARAEGDAPAQLHNVHKLSYLPRESQRLLRHISPLAKRALEATWRPNNNKGKR